MSWKSYMTAMEHYQVSGPRQEKKSTRCRPEIDLAMLKGSLNRKARRDSLELTERLEEAAVMQRNRRTELLEAN